MTEQHTLVDVCEKMAETLVLLRIRLEQAEARIVTLEKIAFAILPDVF